MAPTADQATLNAASAGTLTTARSRARFRPGDAVVIGDVIALGALFWLAKIIFNLDNSMAVFAVATFAAVVGPSARRCRLSATGLDDAGYVVRGVAIAYVIASIAHAVIPESIQDLQVLLIVAGATIPTLLAARSVSYAVERVIRRHSMKDRVVLIGDGETAARLTRTLKEHPEYGLEVVGAVNDADGFNQRSVGTPFLGTVGQLRSVIDDHQVDALIVTEAEDNDPIITGALRAACETGVTVWVVPRLFELGSKATSGEHLWGIPVVRLNDPARRRPALRAKRAFDIVASALGILIASPILLAIAVAIVIEDRGPVLYRQQRIASADRLFDMLKFRSMRVATEEEIQAEWNAELDRRTQGNASVPGSEMRTTRVGRFIRATGLDELPQLFNILKGDMSLVGPRPERPFFVEELSREFPSFEQRHRLPVGLTGLSQVHGLRGDDTSVEERIIFDNQYIENWSMAQDLKILLRTAKTLVKP
jgi:exopolysaccharide biosynthesis polyprenyl glycosylphosphotransferase